MTGIEMFDFKPFRPSFFGRGVDTSTSVSWFDLSDILEPPESQGQRYIMHDRHYLFQVGRDSGLEQALAALGYTKPILKLTTESRLTVSDLSLLDADKENIENFTIRENNYLIDIHTRPYRLRYHQLQAYQSLLRLSDPNNQNSHERIETVAFSPTRSTAVASFIKASFPHRTPMVKQEWVCLQDPKADFTNEKPRLPGQRYPGLGIARLFLNTMAKGVDEKGYGMFFTPEHFHTALLYKKAGAKFASPLMEGYFQALCEDLEPLIKEEGLAAVSWGLGEGRIVDVNGDDDERQDESRVVRYLAQEQLAPISPPILQYLESVQYRAFVDEAYLLSRGKTLKILI